MSFVKISESILVNPSNIDYIEFIINGDTTTMFAVINGRRLEVSDMSEDILSKLDEKTELLKL